MTYPQSRWAVALETQLGREYYRVGRYSKALATWKHVWDTGHVGDENKMPPTVHGAGSELAMMYARLGRMRELKELLAQFEHTVAVTHDGVRVLTLRPDEHPCD